MIKLFAFNNKVKMFFTFARSKLPGPVAGFPSWCDNCYELYTRNLSGDLQVLKREYLKVFSTKNTMKRFVPIASETC